MSFYDYTIEQIESRVLADCNRERLKEHRQCAYCHLCFDCIVYKDHRQCDYCHLCFDCKAYKERMGIDLCKFLDNYEGGKKNE